MMLTCRRPLLQRCFGGQERLVGRAARECLALELDWSLCSLGQSSGACSALTWVRSRLSRGSGAAREEVEASGEWQLQRHDGDALHDAWRA